MNQSIKVWDPLVRIFHWSLAISFALAWLTADEWDDLHEWAGYAASALIAVRVVWGLVGPRYARFGQFVHSPKTVTGYVLELLRGTEPRYIGHNPAGGVMVVALMLTLALTALTGWMSTLAPFSSAEWLEETHEVMANGVLVLVIVHIAGVLFESVRHHENLVRAMFNGRKRAPGPGDVA